MSNAKNTNTKKASATAVIMSHYFAFQLSEESKINTLALFERADAGEINGLNQAVAENTKNLMDEMLQAFLFDMLEQAKVKPFAEKIMMGSGSLIKKTSLGLINKVLLKQADKEMIGILEFTKSQIVMQAIDGEEVMYMGLALPDELADQYLSITSNIENKQFRGQNQALASFFNQLTHIGLNTALKEPSKLLRLSYMSQKIVDVAHAGMNKALSAATPKLIGGLNDRDLVFTVNSLQKFWLSA